MKYIAKQFKLVCLRETPLPETMKIVDDANKAFDYWKIAISTAPEFTPEQENLFVLFLNIRRKVIGHQLVALGTLDGVCVHPREIFRAAIVNNSHSIILMHNHPSGESSPSEADIRITRDLRRAGGFLRVELLDHVIVGENQRSSLRELGYF
jgi:DNA repair protein RadC